MAESLELEHDDKVPEIGIGSGYAVAVTAGGGRAVVLARAARSAIMRAACETNDEWIGFDETRAVDALPVREQSTEAPETFPFGL